MRLVSFKKNQVLIVTFLTRCYIFSNDIEVLDQPSTSVVKSEPEEPAPSRTRQTVDSDDEDDHTNYLAPDPDPKRVRTGEETHYIPNEYSVVQRKFGIIKGENTVEQ